MMTLLPYARMAMTLSIIVFFGMALLHLTGTIGQQAQYASQAAALTSFGLAFGTVAVIMRTWLWRISLVVAACQTAMGIASLLWLTGAFR